MNFAQQTADYLTGHGPVSLETLRTLGLPSPKDAIEANFYAYWDTVYYPLTALGSISKQEQLFTKSIGSAHARNLLFPITSDLAFLNYVITCDVSFFLAPTFQGEPVEIDGQTLGQVYDYFLQSTFLRINVSNKLYLHYSLAEWANFDGPSIVNSLVGQAAPAPFTPFPGAFNNHHRVALELSPPIAWPANSDVQITVDTNVASWWKDVTTVAPVLADVPWATEVGAIMKFDFIGNQARVTK